MKNIQEVVLEVLLTTGQKGVPQAKRTALIGCRGGSVHTSLWLHNPVQPVAQTSTKSESQWIPSQRHTLSSYVYNYH